MVVDWLIVWGVVEAAGILVKPILEDLAKDATKDYTKDFFKDCLKKVIHLPEKDVQKEAYGKALKEFLELVQQELEDAGYQEAQIKQYIQPLKQFIKNEKVAAILGQAFELECRSLNTKVLAQTWQDLNLPNLPPDFDWDLVCKLYIRKVKATVQKSDKLRPIFAAEAQAAAAESLQALVGIAPEFDLGRYAEGLREQYGNLKLESLDTTGVYYNELKLWKVFVPQNVRECQEFLPQVYEIPKEHLRRLRERRELDEAELAAAEMERFRRVYVEQPIRSVLEVVGDPTVPITTPLQHTVILGDPGSGKSTLLQYLALIWAERSVNELSLAPTPLLIELRTYARDKQEKKCHDILSFIHSGNITYRLNQQQLHEKLKTGQAIALFDGIDEVFDPQLRDEVVTDIHRFTNDYPQVQAIVTSRWLGYKAQRLRDAGFRHFMLQDLEPEQIQDFIQRWHDLTFQEGLDKTRKQERLQKAIEESKAIRELAGNPLLLTMMAILNRNQELPRDRPELYNQASRVLLHQWDVERNLIEHRLDPMTINYRDKQAMLRKVAYHMQSSEKGLAGNIISATDLESVLTNYLKTLEVEQPRTVARLIIQQLRTRNFILCYLGADSYAFVHRTFLEYFCAWEFVQQFEKKKILTFEQLRDEIFGKHWQDETWHEVLRLICVMIDAKFSEELIRSLIGQKTKREVFAERILIHVSDSKETLELEQVSLPAKSFNDLILAIGCLEEILNFDSTTQINTELLHKLQYEIEHSKAPLNWHALNALLRPISKHFQGDKTFLSWLKALIHRVDEELMGRQSILLIAEFFGNQPDTLSWLKDIAENKKWQLHYRVREAAVEAIARFFGGDPSIFELIRNAAKKSYDESVRKLAIQSLSEYWSHIPEVFELLIEITKNDPFIRRAISF